jgi:two-component system response regulator AtoC
MTSDRPTVLVIDDEENLRLILENILTAEGYRVFTAEDGASGLAVLDRETVDLILCDVRMPEMDGPAFLEAAKARGIAAPIIMISAYGTVDSAVEAIKAGAFDYVFKPFKPDEILLTLKKAEEREALIRENLALRRAAEKAPASGVVARSRAMRDIMVMAERAARVKSCVLITGESGTGKELVARAIHSSGPRKGQPFIAVNCGAIPDNLLESELFGHVKGAFTDAVQDRPGLFREADQGVLFLDEVGELPGPLQVKLLRAIQFEEVRPVGGAGAVKVDVRIVAAAGKDLGSEAAAGRFRQDLFYRLNVLPLNIPPLRKRPEDIPLLIDHFLTAAAARLGRPKPLVGREAQEAFLRYAWPGNVRELENLIERLMILAPRDRLEVADLPDHIRSGVVPAEAGADEDDLDLKSGIKALEARMIKKALMQCGGNRSEAARRLKISYPSLLSKIKAYGLENY